MPAPVETTAAMTEPAPQHTPALGSEAARQGVSPNVVMGVFGGLLTTLLGALIGLMMWQFSSLGSRIDAQSARIDSLRTELRAELRAEIGGLRTELRNELHSEIGGLRAEMQAGFREINAILLDHTDRLARLEAAAGLPRSADAPQ